MFGSGQWRTRFQRVLGSGNKVHPIQTHKFRGIAGDDLVANVHRIKGAAQNPNSWPIVNHFGKNQSIP